jgi:hypothetical protein
MRSQIIVGHPIPDGNQSYQEIFHMLLSMLHYREIGGAQFQTGCAQTALTWAIFSFQPYKSPGMDGIMPIMLQRGFELLAGKLLMLLQASLALGYIPVSWRHTKVVFITKSGKSLTQAKSLRPISLMSFILKILEKLIDRQIKGGVPVEKPFHQNQYAYRAGMSMETAVFQVVQRLEKCLEHKEIALGAFLEIEGAFDNTSFKTIIMAARECGLKET